MAGDSKTWEKLVSEKELKKMLKEHSKKKKDLALRMPSEKRRKPESQILKEFKSERLEEIKPRDWFEKLSSFSAKIGISPPGFMKRKLQKDIEIAALRTTPQGVFTFTLISFIFTAILFGGIGIAYGGAALAGLFAPFIVSYYLYTYPSYRASLTTLKVQNNMLLATLYMAIYLRLNPIMEGAVEFASKYVPGELGDDFKKVLWDVEIKKHPSIDSSLGAYSKRWSEWDENFVRSMDMFHSSLLEPDRKKKDEAIDEALDIQLDSNHMRMRRYADALTNPIRLLFAMFVMLPLMVLAMIPIIGIFLAEELSPVLLVMIFNILLPLATFYYSMRTLSRRPGTFAINIQKHPELPKKGTFNVYGIPIPILPLSILVGLVFSYYGLSNFSSIAFFSSDASTDPAVYFESMLQSWSLVLGAAAALITYFYLSSFQAIEIRNQIRKIEEEFRSGLRELGIVLSQNIPMESAIDSVISEYKRFNLETSSSYKFFVSIIESMKGSGMTFRRALFDPKQGVINDFPSVIIEDVMAAIVEAMEKGPKQVSLACVTISKYLDRVSDINNTVYSLLSETISSISLLTIFVIPLVAAVAASMGALLTRFLSVIASRLVELANSFGSTFGAQVAFGEILPLSMSEVISPPLLQLIVGFYAVEMIVILAILRDGIENGYDETTRNMHIASQLSTGIVVYSMLLFVFMIILNMIAVGLA